jgi:hypothetical protein
MPSLSVCVLKLRSSPEPQTGRFEVRQQLSLMNGGKLFNAFQFDNQPSFHEKVKPLPRNLNVFIAVMMPLLPLFDKLGNGNRARFSSKRSA